MSLDLYLFVLIFFLAIWNIGNIGRERGSIWLCLLSAYLVYPIRYFVYDEAYWLTITIVVPALVFDTFSKEWLLVRPKRRSLRRRLATLSFCALLYLTVIGGYFYFNGTITDSDGDTIPLHEAITNAFKSPVWSDLKKALNDTWAYAKHHGFYETWKQILDSLDADGEQNAYKVIFISFCSFLNYLL